MKYFLPLILAFSMVACKQKTAETADTQPAAEMKDTVALPVLTQLWASDTTLTTAESVIFDEKYGVFYVSCIGKVPPDAKDKDGFIARLNQKGEIMKQKWVTGLSGPKGMALKGDSLYVTDIDALVIINVATGKLVKRIPVKGAKFLNDADVDAAGVVYFSDSNTNTVHSFDGKEVKVFYQGEALGGPNGIYNEADRLVMASFGKGHVYTLSKTNPTVESKVDTLAGGDGVEAFNDGYLVSSWNGEVYFVDKDWKKHLLLDTKPNKLNAADIEYVPSQKLLLVPEFFGNKVTAYEVK
ncbi:MAG: gluconolaconase [Saprospiraceae bacterium]|nr:gluconolaconase [Saprospiraceae bacterium]